MRFYEITDRYKAKKCKNIFQAVARVKTDSIGILAKLEKHGYFIDLDDVESLVTCAKYSGLKYVYYDLDGKVFAFVDENYRIEFEDILCECRIHYFIATTGRAIQ